MKPFVVTFLSFLASVLAENPHGALEMRTEKLEQRYEREIASLQEDYNTRFTELERHVISLENNNKEYSVRISQLEQTIVNLESKNENIDRKNSLNKALLYSHEKILENCKLEHVMGKEKPGVENTVRIPPEKIVQKTAAMRGNHETSQRNKDTRTWNKKAVIVGDGTNIAFTAYLDHDIDNQGPNQVLVFNKMLLNHGGGYNNYSGVFTAPVPGVYSFAFFIGQRDVNQFFVRLVVNSKHMLDAVVETSHSSQDLQGGNAANLLLAQGDTVFLRHISNAGSHLEGNANGNRITSFSGFLTYPVEPSLIVGK